MEVYKAKDEVRNIPGSRTRETYGRGILLEEALRRESLNKEISEMRRVTVEIHYL